MAERAAAEASAASMMGKSSFTAVGSVYRATTGLRVLAIIGICGGVELIFALSAASWRKGRASHEL